MIALDKAPQEEEVRAFWNAKENTVLDHVTDGQRLWLGRTRAITPEEPRSPGPAGRVFDVIFLRGTLPDYSAPLVTDELVAGILAAFTSEVDPTLPSTDAGRLEVFLNHHAGAYLVVDG